MKHLIEGTQRSRTGANPRVVYKYRHAFTPAAKGTIITPNVIEIVVAYSDYRRRGVTVSVGVIEHTADGFDSRVLLGDMDVSGKTYFVLEAKRYSPKIVAEVAERLDAIVTTIAETWPTDTAYADTLAQAFVTGFAVVQEVATV